MAEMLWTLLSAPPRLVLGGGLCLCLGLWLFWRFLRRLARGPRSAPALLLSFLLSIALSGVGLLGLTLGAHLSAYTAFSARTRVAEVQCFELSPKKLRLHLDPILGDGTRGPTEIYDLSGDEWTVGGDVLRFRPFLSALGLQTVFRISRVEGRFSDAEEARRQKPTAFDREADPLPVWLSLYRHSDHAPLRWLVDGAHGQSISQLPDRRAIFDIFIGKDGFVLTKHL
jgi:hypothetical protein